MTAREQSKEHRSWPHVSVIPRLRKVIGTLHRNLDSPPVISPQRATLSRGGVRVGWRRTVYALFVSCVILPGILVDSCSPDGYSLCREEHKVTTENGIIKRPSADAFVMASLRKTKAPFTVDVLETLPPTVPAACCCLMPLWESLEIRTRCF